MDAVLVLANGDVAISGGPCNFEVLIYRHNYRAETGQREHLAPIDSLDTDG